MRELTKKQKIKVLDEMIKLQDDDTGLCDIYVEAMWTFNYSFTPQFWTPRFKELDVKIASEIGKTNKKHLFIRYEYWKQGRINLLKELKKEL